MSKQKQKQKNPTKLKSKETYTIYTVLSWLLVNFFSANGPLENAIYVCYYRKSPYLYILENKCLEGNLLDPKDIYLKLIATTLAPKKTAPVHTARASVEVSVHFLHSPSLSIFCAQIYLYLGE